MGLRVTQNLITQRVLANLNRQTRRLLALQDQISTGFRVNRPSDDPIDARRAVSVRQLITQNEQFISNIVDVQPVLTESTEIFGQAVDLVMRARELTLQGANGTNSQEQRDAIALEVNQLLETMLGFGNHQTNGRFIFGGTNTLNRPFVETRVGGEISTVAYEGNSEHIATMISRDLTVEFNETGDAAFQGMVDVFALLAGIRDDLRAGNTANLGTMRLDELESAQDQLLLSQARLGAVQNRVDRVTQNLEDFTVQLQEVLSEKIDADMAEVFVEFNAQSNAFTAALNASARVIQPSLLDFVR